MKAAFLAVLVVVSLSGCGTVCNLAGGIIHPESEPRVYGGVVKDLEVIDRSINAPPNSMGGDVRLAPFLLALAVGDPILSFVADTLTLPITIPLQARRISVEHQNEDCTRSGRTDSIAGAAVLKRPTPVDQAGEEPDPAIPTRAPGPSE
jgi:hypothetical protein